MIRPRIPDITVVVASCRPKWLANCLYLLKQQERGRLCVETIVVAEGDSNSFRSVLDRHAVDRAIHKPVQGLWGAYAKDVGLEAARGRYVVWWDDDNIYYPHALASLHAAAAGHDIGIVRTAHMALRFVDIPRYGTGSYGDIDGMCFCVRRKLALRARWSDHREKGTDHAYISKLMLLSQDVNLLDVRVGEKLEDVPRVETA